MNFLTSKSQSTSALVFASLLLSACADDGTVTVLPARPSVGLELPRVLLDAQSIVQDNLRPLVTLSNGATVSMQRGEGNTWNGTINVAPATDYLVTVTWVERLESFDGRELPLAQLTQDLAVAADGSVTQSNTSGYSTDIDTDGDGRSNFEERENGSNPFDSNNGNAPVTPPADDANPEQPGEPVQPDAPLDTPLDPDPTTEIPGDPTTIPVVTPVPDTEPEDEDEQEDGPDPAPDPVQESTPEVADVIVPRIAASAAPLINGQDVTLLDSQNRLTGEWSAAVQSDNSGAPLTINNLIRDIDADAEDGTPHRRWAAMHDGTYLYVLVLVDDDGQRHRDSAFSLIDDDSLEIFIDGDNSKNQFYDGIDDFHRILPLQLAGADKQSADSGDIAGPNSSDETLLLDFATGPGIGPDGIRRPRFEQDVYEIRILLESANIDTDTPFGFELQVNDDDDGIARDAKWAWKHPSREDTDVDGTFRNPSLMGTLILE